MRPIRTVAEPTALSDTAAGTPSGTWIERVPEVPDEEVDGHRTDPEFVALRAAYRATGGAARGDDLARVLEDQRRAYFMSLEKLIALGAVFGFERHATFWVPMFQFEPSDLSIKRGPGQVRAELAPLFGGWTLAVWFVRPSFWLNGRRPVDLLDSNLPAVLEAARVDRFIAAERAQQAGPSIGMASRSFGPAQRAWELIAAPNSGAKADGTAAMHQRRGATRVGHDDPAGKEDLRLRPGGSRRPAFEGLSTVEPRNRST